MGYPGEFEILVLLAVQRLGEEAYGVTVVEELERRTSRTVTLGAVYKVLGRLKAKGHVEARTGAPTAERGGRRKKLYRVTASGRAAVARSLEDFRRMAEGLEPGLEAS